MTPDLRARYLDLLKKSLTDCPHVDSDHANAMPLEWLEPKSPLKGLRDRGLTAVARGFGYSLAKGDRLDAAERARRRRGGDRHHTVPFLAVGIDQVRANFEKYDLLNDRVRFVEGYFQDTLAAPPAERLALPRLDGDMYASTTVALEALHDRLSPGGFAIVDDYHLGPCREAVNDFRRARGVAGEIVDIDGLAAYWRKG